jgi:hypothetical protein
VALDRLAAAAAIASRPELSAEGDSSARVLASAACDRGGGAALAARDAGAAAVSLAVAVGPAFVAADAGADVEREAGADAGADAGAVAAALAGAPAVSCSAGWKRA